MLINKERLKDINYYVLDMDGTIYLGDKLIDGSLDFINYLQENKKNFMFFTNNSSKNSLFYEKRLKKMGFNIGKEKIITSGMVTIEYLKKNYNNKRVFLLGTELLEKEFEDNGIKLVEKDADIVVVGFDTTITYDKLSKACDFIREGKPFIATHLDLNCPTEDGYIPDCGAICAFITASTGVKPRYIGKPFSETVDYILNEFKCSKSELAFIGDRLYTDISIGVKHNICSILVLTGETKIGDVEKSDIKPDIIANSLENLIIK